MTEEEIIAGLRHPYHRQLKFMPMLCGSAFKNKGVQRMLDAVIELLPSPVDIPPVPDETEDGAADNTQGR